MNPTATQRGELPPARDFDSVARLPAEGDNVAIACKRLDAGTTIASRHGTNAIIYTLSHTILEGHRFAAVSIPKGAPLLSWGMAFGHALNDIAPGDYICNEKILQALASRHVDFQIPREPNFADHYVKFQFDEAAFRPGRPNPIAETPGVFEGFFRTAERGVGTRNFVVVLGTSSWTASYARLLADRFKSGSGRFPNIDGVVPVAHTEGGEQAPPNNLEFTLRTLAGFMVHPNVAAVLAVDYGTEAVNNKVLEGYMRKHGYPLDQVLHRFLSVQSGFQNALEEGQRIINSWMGVVNGARRTPQPLKYLKLGLQCGGSDAFSGVSGNPLVGLMAHELVHHGGAANLAETDELIGAEAYILSNIKDAETAKQFLKAIEVFSERAGWHGHNAEGNPSGGNNFRGLYNIAIKSIGAARKKAPHTCVDWVIDFAQPMKEPGYYFMDSPGNDLESIAGQVGAGCNAIVFTTGNGSITNFPFVPTIKVVTTTGRYNLVKKDMDFNAGRYQDGESMETLAREAFDLLVQTASGKQSVGEKAGHCQVQLWREWRQTGPNNRPSTNPSLEAPGETKPFPVKPGQRSTLTFRHLCQQRTGQTCLDQVGLLVPTSLCASQVGRNIVERLNRNASKSSGISRFVALPHTEGCGCSSGDSEELMLRLLTGHIFHPSVRAALLLEHGCEKTHNDALRNHFKTQQLQDDCFGFASIQMDGGIDAVTDKITDWFNRSLSSPTGSDDAPDLNASDRSAASHQKSVSESGLDKLCLGLTASGPVSELLASSFSAIVRTLIHSGATVIIPENSPLLQSPEFVGSTFLEIPKGSSIQFGQVPTASGLHVMSTPTHHRVETFVGMVSSGVSLLVAGVSENPIQGHPMVGLLQIADPSGLKPAMIRDVDLILNAAPSSQATVTDAAVDAILQLIVRTASREYTPKAVIQGNVDFQISRGLFGVSL